MQSCQLSQIIQETPDFGPYLPFSRWEYEISQNMETQSRTPNDPGPGSLKDG